MQFLNVVLKIMELFLFMILSCIIIQPINISGKQFDIPSNIMYSDIKEIEDVELIENITLNVGHDMHRVLKSNNVSDQGHGLEYSLLVFEQARVQHFKNCELSNWGVFVSGKGYVPADFPDPRKNEGTPVPTQHTLENYRMIVCGFTFYSTFGHFLQDVLCPILEVPCEITARADIFIRYEFNTARNYMAFLGYDLSKVHHLENQWVHANELYIVKPNYFHNGMHVSWGHLHDVIYQKYDLEKIKPVNHIIWNKTPGKWGHIKNIEDVFSLTKKTYPQYNWYILPWTACNELEFLAKEFASAKLVLSSSGSFSFNMLYLHRESGILIMGNWYTDTPVMAAACSLDLWLIYMSISSLSILDKDGKDINATEILTCLDDIIYMTYNRKLPDDHEKRYKLFFDWQAEYKKWEYIFVNRTHFMHYSKRFGVNNINNTKY